MKQDARLIINKKKGRFPRQNGGIRNTGQRITTALDARKIIISKRAGHNQKRTNFIRNKPFVQRRLQVSPQKTNKHVKVSTDGNIWITSKSKMSSPQNITRTAFNRDVEFSSSNTRFQWTPAEVDMDDLEHARIEDVVDVSSLPSASSIRAPVQTSAVMAGQSLAEEVMQMSNTMVADQVQTSILSLGSQVVVSNLCSSVSKQDIVELFADVGLIKSVAMTHPGTAVIEFYNQLDAAQACTAYHNRLLDGQPMKCYLQPDTVPQRVSISQRLGDRVQEVPRQPSLPRAAVMTNTRLRTNPRDVHFTVKLA